MTAAICIGLYAVCAAGYLIGNHRWNVIQRGRKIHGDYPGCVPVPWPMKRPPITQADVDATWLEVWQDDAEPADIDTLEQRVYDRLFDELVAMEGLQ